MDLQSAMQDDELQHKEVLVTVEHYGQSYKYKITTFGCCNILSNCVSLSSPIVISTQKNDSLLASNVTSNGGYNVTLYH